MHLLKIISYSFNRLGPSLKNKQIIVFIVFFFISAPLFTITQKYPRVSALVHNLARSNGWFKKVVPLLLRVDSRELHR